MIDPRVALDAEHALKQHAERVVEAGASWRDHPM